MIRRALFLLALACALAAASPVAAKAEVHTVYAGQTLRAIAKRYLVSIDAICHANGISPNRPIKPGQKLVIPPKEDKTGEQTRQQLERSRSTSGSERAKSSPPTGTTSKGSPATTQREPERPKALPPKKPSWTRYVKPARRKGYVILQASGRSWKGYAIVKGNRVATPARQAFRRVLYSWRTGSDHEIDVRLIRLLVQVSDKFGGRPLRVASGYREKSYARESKHKLGRACDFSVEGVPNDVLRDYLATLDGVGVGYYPNSSFVHLDVRPKTMTWTDFSGPGEPPRRRSRSAASAEEDAGPEASATMAGGPVEAADPDEAETQAPAGGDPSDPPPHADEPPDHH